MLAEGGKKHAAFRVLWLPVLRPRLQYRYVQPLPGKLKRLFECTTRLFHFLTYRKWRTCAAERRPAGLRSSVISL
jgi:hypothetical protein